MYLKHVISAGILSAALAFGPGAAFAQTSGSTSGTSGTTLAGQHHESGFRLAGFQRHQLAGLPVWHHDLVGIVERTAPGRIRRFRGRSGSGAPAPQRRS